MSASDGHQRETSRHDLGDTAMRTTLISAFFLSALSAPAIAQDAGREAPAYYLDGLFALAAAENVARFCPTLSINLEATSALTTDLLAQLTEEGIAPEDIPKLAGVAEGFDARQAEFMGRHALQGADIETVCAAGRLEIAEATPVGALMRPVPLEN